MTVDGRLKELNIKHGIRESYTKGHIRVKTRVQYSNCQFTYSIKQSEADSQIYEVKQIVFQPESI